MSRSLKKGPYIDEKLLSKVRELNQKRKKTIIKLGQEVQRFFL